MNRSHGKRNDPAYLSWLGMKSRCRNPNREAYANYGGRGITMCAEWEKFENFYRDMGPRPEGMSLDRIDNNLGYTPANCRWADRRTQSRNRRAKLVEVDGVAKPLWQWSEQTGISISTLWARIESRGWSADKAIKTPLQRQGRKKDPLAFGAEHGVVWSDPETRKEAA